MVVPSVYLKSSALMELIEKACVCVGSGLGVLIQKRRLGPVGQQEMIYISVTFCHLPQGPGKLLQYLGLGRFTRSREVIAVSGVGQKFTNLSHGLDMPEILLTGSQTTGFLNSEGKTSAII